MARKLLFLIAALLFGLAAGGLAFATHSTPPPPAGEWEILDMGATAPVHDISVSPNNPNVLFATIDCHGVRKSTDRGVSWSSENRGVITSPNPQTSAPIGGVRAFSSNKVLMGTNSFAKDVLTIYVSDNGGTNWTRATITPSIPFSAGGFLAFSQHPTASNTFYSLGTTGFYRSVDGGYNWTQINATVLPSGQLRGRGKRAIHINPANANEMVITAEGGAGVYRSTDGGVNWATWNTGLPVGASVRSLITADFNTFYATVRGVAPTGVYRRVGNDNWVRVGGTSLPSASGDAYDDVIQKPGSPNTLYTVAAEGSAYGLYKSTDGGNTWTRLRLFQTGVDSYYATVAKLRTLDFAGNSLIVNGILGAAQFRTDDDGATWTNLMSERITIGGETYWRGRGLQGSGVISFAIDPTNPNRMYAGHWDFGIFRSEDGGHSWQWTLNRDWGNHIAIDPLNPANVYAAMTTDAAGRRNEGALFKSTNYGKTWTLIGGDPDNRGGLPWGRPDAVTVNPANPNMIWAFVRSNTALPSGMYRSVDGGTTWQHLANSPAWGNGAVALALDRQQPNNVYIGWINGGFYVSRNANAANPASVTWIAISTTDKIMNIQVDPSDGNKLYVERIIDTGNDEVRQSLDARTNLTFRTILSDESLKSLVVSPHNGNRVYVTTWRSSMPELILRRTDNALAATPTWTGVNDPRQPTYPTFGDQGIAVDPHDPDIVYYGVICNGIWKRNFSP